MDNSLTPNNNKNGPVMNSPSASSNKSDNEKKADNPIVSKDETRISNTNPNGSESEVDSSMEEGDEDEDDDEDDDNELEIDDETYQNEI